MELIRHGIASRFVLILIQCISRTYSLSLEPARAPVAPVAPSKYVQYRMAYVRACGRPEYAPPHALPWACVDVLSRVYPLRIDTVQKHEQSRTRAVYRIGSLPRS